jgi:signal transduction histidine kinase
MISIVALAVLGVSGITVVSDRQILAREIRQNHEQIVQQLAKVSEESLYQNNIVFYQYVKTLQGERGFKGACFADAQGMVQFHSDSALIDTALTVPPGAIDYDAPVIFAGGAVGSAHLFISKDAIQQFLNDALLKNLKRIGLIALIVLGLAFLAALLWAQAMVTPIQRVVAGMRRVSEGKLEKISFPQRRDELGWMGRELNVTIQKLKESEDMKENFFSRITHELRSPLIAIDGLMAMFMRGTYGALSPPQKEKLLSVQNKAGRLQGLVDDLLTTTKLEAKGERLNLAKVDIRALIEETAQLFRPIAEEKGIDLGVTPLKDPLTVWADAEKSKHILNNLVSNAVKFTKRGTVTLGAINGPTEVSIQVKDTGMGIPEAEKKTIFNKFYRTPQSEKIKGTGLGLHIVKSLVELQGGEIDVTDNPGGGTVFSFTLPGVEKRV